VPDDGPRPTFHTIEFEAAEIKIVSKFGSSHQLARSWLGGSLFSSEAVYIQSTLASQYKVLPALLFTCISSIVRTLNQRKED